MLLWLTRCLPGFSLLALACLLLSAFSDTLKSPSWKGRIPRPGDGSKGETEKPLNMAQEVFVIYTIFIHVNMFVFTLRLAFSLFSMTKKTRGTVLKHQPDASMMALSEDGTKSEGRRSVTSGLQKQSDLPAREPTDEINDSNHSRDLIHAIILPNYCEDLDTLRTTLTVLASHPTAKWQYDVYLAMEQKESSAAAKAARLLSEFEKSFLHIGATFHPSGLVGEIAGKSSNVAFAARHILEAHRTALRAEPCNVLVTVMDADSHLSQYYFAEIQRLNSHHLGEADRSFYCCPIIFDRNSHDTPVLVRCADLLWGFAGLSTMYPGTWLALPTSVYSLPLALVERVGGWDSDPTAIGEDLHMLLKCYFGTQGDIVTRVVPVPASQCNVSSDKGRGWRRQVETLFARYRQGLRHMWGALDTGFAARQMAINLRLGRRRLFPRLRDITIVHLLWEAHFLPCHLTVLLVFSVLYELCVPTTQVHPAIAWAFWFTGLLRTLSFIGMNVNLSMYGRWHAMCLDMRMQDMRAANLTGTGCSRRTWYQPQYLLERICFPVAGTVFGALPTLHAVFAHFWTDRLVYRVSQKPVFSVESSAIV
ncbi:glycosyl transferase family group 2-domain-containing protein [Paecilomyces variotii]|uniref:Glycosyl transferase family group 2-domain-containing protein n=1 Tax=Byssochlamys spectabilis TaxID=264951 RepID=A0A443HL76_BYSSP|nr:glycosyl transferase family group 2-domain-containing protein [Paecilomyces variotii]KAJ9353463.1 CAZyme family GT2 [Paecilomyces variotii]RWQ92569.1 glycosyl transferase family group 2-domain-containing protein [Paecilomyces variotii]